MSDFTIFNLVIRLSKVEQLAVFWLFTLLFVVGWTTGRSTGLRLLSLFTAVETSFSTLIERLTSFWHCNIARVRLQDMPFRCCHFLLVDLVKSSCARIRGLTTSAAYGVDLNFRPLSLISCIGLWTHQFVIETCWIIWYWFSRPPGCDPSSPPVPPIFFPWSPFSSLPPPCHMNTPCRAARSQHGTLGLLWFSVGGFKWCSCTQHQSSLLAYLLSTLQSPHSYHPCRLTF